MVGNIRNCKNSLIIDGEVVFLKRQIEEYSLINYLNHTPIIEKNVLSGLDNNL